MRPCWRAGAGVLLGGCVSPQPCLLPLMKSLGKLETGWRVLSCTSNGLLLEAMIFLDVFQPFGFLSFYIWGAFFYAVRVENWEINVILHCAKLDVFVYDGLFTREPIQKELWKKPNRKGWNNDLDKKHHRQCSNTIVRFTVWKIWQLCPNPNETVVFLRVYIRRSKGKDQGYRRSRGKRAAKALLGQRLTEAQSLP